MSSCHFLTLSFLALLLGSVAHAYTWSSCSDDAPLLVKDVVLDPADVSRGQPLAVRIITELGADKPQLTGGKLAASVSYLGFKVYSTSDDLCSTVACPVQPGPVTISTTQNMPGWAPRGMYKLRFEGRGPLAAAFGGSSSTSAYDASYSYSAAAAQDSGAAVVEWHQGSSSSSSNRRLLMSSREAAEALTAAAQHHIRSSTSDAGREALVIADYDSSSGSSQANEDDVTLVCVDVEFDMH